MIVGLICSYLNKCVFFYYLIEALFICFEILVVNLNAVKLIENEQLYLLFKRLLFSTSTDEGFVAEYFVLDCFKLESVVAVCPVLMSFICLLSALAGIG